MDPLKTPASAQPVAQLPRVLYVKPQLMGELWAELELRELFLREERYLSVRLTRHSPFAHWLGEAVGNLELPSWAYIDNTYKIVTGQSEFSHEMVDSTLKNQPHTDAWAIT